MSGRARLLEGDEAQRAKALLSRRHPVFQRMVVPLAHKLARYQTLHYEVTLDPDQGAQAVVPGA